MNHDHLNSLKTTIVVLVLIAIAIWIGYTTFSLIIESIEPSNN